MGFEDSGYKLVWNELFIVAVTQNMFPSTTCLPHLRKPTYGEEAFDLEISLQSVNDNIVLEWRCCVLLEQIDLFTAVAKDLSQSGRNWIVLASIFSSLHHVLVKWGAKLYPYIHFLSFILEICYASHVILRYTTVKSMDLRPKSGLWR